MATVLMQKLHNIALYVNRLSSWIKRKPFMQAMEREQGVLTLEICESLDFLTAVLVNVQVCWVKGDSKCAHMRNNNFEIEAVWACL